MLSQKEFPEKITSLETLKQDDVPNVLAVGKFKLKINFKVVKIISQFLIMSL